MSFEFGDMSHEKSPQEQFTDIKLTLNTAHSPPKTEYLKLERGL